MARKSRNEGFVEWAIRGLVRGVVGIILAVVAAYLVYNIAVWTFTQGIGT